MIPVVHGSGDDDSSDVPPEQRALRVLRNLEQMQTVRLAQGIVMAAHGVAATEAIDFLVDRARHEGERLGVVAQVVVNTGQV